ncbi:MAG: hypothetical protein QW474_01625 [Candidatus Aenigmatarchaeota archaeon]
MFNNISEEEKKNLQRFLSPDIIDFIEPYINKLRDFYIYSLGNSLIAENNQENVDIYKKVYYIKGKIDLLNEFSFFLKKVKKVREEKQNG